MIRSAWLRSHDRHLPEQYTVRVILGDKQLTRSEFEFRSEDFWKDHLTGGRNLEGFDDGARRLLLRRGGFIGHLKNLTTIFQK